MTDETLRRTPLFEDHQKLGARIVDFAGWAMPVQYAGVSKEHQGVREAVGLFDVSHMGELFVRGPNALHCVNSLITNDLRRAELGQAQYTCACNEQGTILDDLIVYRLAPEELMVVCNASNREKISGHFSKACAGTCEFEDASERTGLLAIQGPKAWQVLGAAGLELDDGTSELRPFRVGRGKLAGAACIVARTGYTGEDGAELFCGWNDTAPVWRQLLEAGRDAGIQPIGLAARDTLRLEARLSLYGNEIDETTNPLEAGLGWVVKLDKPDFRGKAALQAIKSQGVSRRIVGFEMKGRGIARHGYPLLDLAGNEVGVCTSGAPSPSLGKNIGLGYLPAGLAKVGSEFLVDCRGRSIPAQVVQTPFYRRPSAG